MEIVGLGTERSNPDYYALSVMNEVFSGGFGSRVVQYVRTKLGLAYDVGGSFGAAYDHPGVFRSEAGTKSATTVAATKAVLEEIGRLKTDPPTPAELSKAKDQVMNSFIFRYDTPEKTLNEQVTLAFYGYPPDFLEKYQGRHRAGHVGRCDPRGQQVYRRVEAGDPGGGQQVGDQAAAVHTGQGHGPGHHHPAAAGQPGRCGRKVMGRNSFCTHCGT